MQGGNADHLLFAALDTERNSVISKEEFMELCTVLKVQWEEEDRATYFERHWPRLYQSRMFQGLRRVVLSTAFQWSTPLPAAGRAATPVTCFLGEQFCTPSTANRKWEALSAPVLLAALRLAARALCMQAATSPCC